MNSASETSALEAHSSPARLWPTRILGPRPGLKEMNVVCWAMFLAFLLVPMCVVQWIQVKHGTASSQPLHTDFVLYYGTGILANKYPAASIYDPQLQLQTFNHIWAATDGPYGVSSYPPFVPFFFSFFARMPFNDAYWLWMVISLALYCIGIGAAARAVFRGEPLKISLIFCFALAFFPFLGETLVNGQLASVAACAAGLAILQEKHGDPFSSGLALALLTYKPTLLLLLLPMLLLTRRFKALSGFIIGAVILGMIGTAFGGIRAWPAYMRLLQYNSHLAGVNGQSVVRLPKYLDLSSISHMIRGGRTPTALMLIAIASVSVAVALAYLLWKSVDAGRPANWLAWAATLTWTLLLNVYVPVYDSVLVIVAIVLTLGALRDLGRRAAAEWITVLAVAIFVASWMTERLAKAHGIPLLSIMLGILGMAELVFLHQAINGRLPLTTPREIGANAASTQ